MALPQTLQFLTVILISGVAGVMNAIAGGGTLLTFPALVGGVWLLLNSRGA